MSTKKGTGPRWPQYAAGHTPFDGVSFDVWDKVLCAGRCGRWIAYQGRGTPNLRCPECYDRDVRQKGKVQ